MDRNVSVWTDTVSERLEKWIELIQYLIGNGFDLNIEFVCMMRR